MRATSHTNLILNLQTVTRVKRNVVTAHTARKGSAVIATHFNAQESDESSASPGQRN
jgi:hypothetical protein